MSRSLSKSGKTTEAISTQTIVLLSLAWAVIALFFYMQFGLRAVGEERQGWYLIFTYIFEEVGYLAAALLCFRNWQCRQMVSGRTVWLFIGLGMFFFFVGNLFFGVWELMFGLDPQVSLGDVFYLPCYAFLAIGMTLAVLPRRLNMLLWQWFVLAAMAAVGSVVTYWLVQISDAAAAALESPGDVPLVEEAITTAPQWAIQFDQALNPFADLVNQLYIVGDVILLIVAFTLLMAFWGGRFSLSWRMIAAATLCQYVADMWFYFAISTNSDYQSGELLEVGWVFSAILFALGAALEYDVSNRSSTRRGGALGDDRQVKTLKLE
jgi:hypothetical protein